MGGKKVVFDKQAGYNFVKGKKRMRGGVKDVGPEVKKYNCWYGSGNQLVSMDFVNNLTGGSAGTTVSYSPRAISWPTVGTAGDQRIGNRIYFRAIRLKGWITVAPDQLMAIRWRMVLCRMDIPTGAYTMNATNYLSQFVNSDVNVPTVWNQEAWASFSRHNFYKKFKNVENKDFKAKVIAGGVLPPTNTYSKLSFGLSGTIGNQTTTLSTSSTSYTIGMHSSNYGYLPLDVTVAINDNVDCSANLRRYFVVFETDVGYGWTDAGAASASEVGMLVNCFCRGYFTDA